MNYFININQIASETYFPKLDIIDLAIFDYICNFYPSSDKYTDNDGIWFWISHTKVINDMPILKIKTKTGIINRINNLINYKILERHPKSKELGKSYYKTGINWNMLIKIDNYLSTKIDTSQRKLRAPLNENCEGPLNENCEYYNTNIYPNTNDQIKDIEIYENFDFFKDEFKNIWINEFLPLKQKKKASLTSRAKKSQLNKIKEYSNNDYSIALKILVKTVDSGWTDFYPLKKEDYIQNKLPTKVPTLRYPGQQ